MLPMDLGWSAQTPIFRMIMRQLVLGMAFVVSGSLCAGETCLPYEPTLTYINGTLVAHPNGWWSVKPGLLICTVQDPTNSTDSSK